MSRTPNKLTLFWGLPRQGVFWLVAALMVSLLLHLLSFVGISRVSRPTPFPFVTQQDQRIPVKILKKKKNSSEERKKKLLETPLEQTTPPEKSTRLGAQDHAVLKETKTKFQSQSKALDPGIQGVTDLTPLTLKPAYKPQKKVNTKETDSLTAEQKVSDSSQKLVNPTAVVTIPRPRENKPRNVYESLIPKAHELANQVKAGYQDYIEEEVDTGDRIDFNTTNFRYLGYFTSVRKAFELVWVYPAEAVRRGLQGEVKLEFTIQKDGTVSRMRVIESSGHKILDEGVVEAIKLASPFAPLPSGMKKDRLTIVGSFRYVLTSYAGAL